MRFLAWKGLATRSSQTDADVPFILSCCTCRCHRSSEYHHPHAAGKIDWADSPFRPFCSERCRLIDLGAWLSEKRAIPAESEHVESDPENITAGRVILSRLRWRSALLSGAGLDLVEQRLVFR